MVWLTVWGELQPALQALWPKAWFKVMFVCWLMSGLNSATHAQLMRAH